MFVPLCVETQYSILSSLISIDALVKRAKSVGVKSLAITDAGNMYGAVEFFKACQKASIRPIIGLQAYLAPESRHHKKRIPGRPAALPVTLLAKNEEGYKSLCLLSSKGHLEGFYYRPRIDKELLKEHAGGLVCMSGRLGSAVAYAALNLSEEEFLEEVKWFQDTFKEDFYLQLERHPLDLEAVKKSSVGQESWLVKAFEDFYAKEKKLEKQLLKAGSILNIPIVATQLAKYLDKEDWKNHEIFINIQTKEPCQIIEKDAFGNSKPPVPNPKREVMETHELNFKTPIEMEALFADLPQAIKETENIAQKCNFSFDFGNNHYPVFTPPQSEEDTRQSKSSADYLKKLCYDNIASRYTEEKKAILKEKFPDTPPKKLISERLEYELKIVIERNIADYLLIVYDFIHWAKTQKIPVGPGRGSGAGSIILYLIGITDIEPLSLSLFFERFINPERPSYPDIDVDICMERRGDVIEYTQKKYGSGNVAQIITFGKMKAKMVVKDVGRVLSVPLSRVNAIAKLIPDDLNITLDKALSVEPDLKKLYDEDAEVHALLESALKLEGAIRNTGIHAAGVIVCRDPIMDHIPLCASKDAQMAVTQYSMKPVEAVGMLKIDFLGLKTLTSIQKAAASVEKRLGKKINWVDLPLDDKPTFDLLNQGKTLGIFQLESGGMRDLATKLHMDRFEEIIAVGALYRPGPMEMIPSFIERKHGREAIDQEHPWMTDILAETYGIMVYQEQVMQIASRLAGYSLGEGDVLRRAMGKKDAKEMANQRVKFCSGAESRGIDRGIAEAIFDKMERFASYGFNKSHAAAYGYLSYVTAFFKANYPEEWMAALMTCDRDDTSKVAKFIHECEQMNIAILPPDVNEARAEFTAVGGAVRFAMSAVRGVGLGVVEAIVEEREQRGRFESLYHFIERMGTKRVQKKMIEHLVDAGAFDFTGWTRDELRVSIEPMASAIEKKEAEKNAGIISLFGSEDEKEVLRFEKPPEGVESTTEEQRLLKEKELLGFFLTGHPLDLYKEKLKSIESTPFSKVTDMAPGAFCSACIIEKVTVKLLQRNQSKFAIVTFSQKGDFLEVPVWPGTYEEFQELLVEGRLVYGVFRADGAGDEQKLACRWLCDLNMLSDEAQEEAKEIKKQTAKEQKRMQKKSKEVEKPEEPKEQLELKVDLTKIRASRVLQLKKLLRSFPGPNPVCIEFQRGGQRVSLLKISAPWGVEISSFLTQSLEKVDGVQSVNTLNIS